MVSSVERVANCHLSVLSALLSIRSSITTVILKKYLSFDTSQYIAPGSLTPHLRCTKRRAAGRHGTRRGHASRADRDDCQAAARRSARISHKPSTAY
eukprot:2070788-Prymnesium_polylepis.4